MIYLSPTLIVGMIKQSVGGKTMLNSQLRILGGIVSVFLIFACADLPEDCGRNVRKVVALDFEGPTVIETTPEFDFTAYDVTITVEKENREDSAQVCYAVRDEDPWYKFFWAVDDVLDANFMVISAGQNSRTFERHFTLFAKDDKEVCGRGALPGDLKVEGCSGEREAEVYLDPQGSDGPDSPIHKIRVE